MADLRKMTVERLRELARKVLGPGHSRLKTKDDLLAALEAAERNDAASPAAKGAARPAARPSAGAAGRAAKGKAARAESPGGTEAGPPRKRAKADAAGRAEKVTAEKVTAKAVQAAGKAAKAGARAAARAGKAAVELAEGVREAVKAKGGQAAPRRRTGKLAAAAAAVGEAAAGIAAAARAGARARRGEKEPGGGPADPAGFFVARVRGEDAVREAPHPMTETAEAAPPERSEPEPDAPAAGEGGFDERLGDLPWGYGDDAFVALPRDPRTLFLYWDLSRETTRSGFEGLDHPRAQLRVFARAGDGWEPVRTLEFALESRGYYVHELDPGRVYRAEIHAVDRRGSDRQVGRGSNEMMLPPLGPSPIIDDRFIRIPWDMPLGRLLGRGHAGGPFSEEARALLARLSDWSRFAVRGGGAASAGGIGGRSGDSWPTSPAPTSPGMGFGGGRGGA
jgi:hypothetical protein